MPKKQPKNGFFYFMLSYKKRAESDGRTFPGGMPEVAAAASPDWNTLPSFRRDYYNSLAKDRRNDPRPNIPKRDERRFNSQGKSFAEIKMEKVRAEERRKQERDFISNFVHEMNLNDLRDKLLYLIHVNIFCKTDKDIYFPAEIGMVKFSMRGGVKGVFHRYIDPGDITPGYSFEVKDHAERTHKLTPQFVRSVDGTSDFTRLYKEICDFLSEDEIKSEDSLPPLFTMYDNVFLNSSIDAVKGTFKSLWAHEHPSDNPDDNNWENVFRVFPLPDMFFHLKNRCVAVANPNTIAFPNDVLARTTLQQDTYHYELDTACKFHRDEDIISHCSQSFVLRWVYIIRDHCALPIGVDLFPKYIAPKTEIKEETDEYYDNASVTDSQYSNISVSDWGQKNERDRYWSPERKVKRERDYSPECKVKREWDRYAPESGVKLERDLYSQDRHVKQERDRHSPDCRVKRERDRYSPDRHVKRERDRYSADRHVKRERDHYSDRHVKRERDPYSPDRGVKRERDRYSQDRRSYSPDRRMKREKNRSYSPERSSRRETDPSPDRTPKYDRDSDQSPERAVKRERDADGYCGGSSVKRERNADDFSGSSASTSNVETPVVKLEDDSDVLYEGTFKREKNESIKKESEQPSTSNSIKPKVEACGYSVPAPFKQTASSSIKQDADSVKWDRDASVKPEKYGDLPEEKPGSVVKDDFKAENDDDVEFVRGPVKMETFDLTDW